MSNSEERDATFARLRAPEPKSDTVTDIDESAPEPTAPVVTYDPGEPAAVVSLRHPFTVDGRHIAELRIVKPSFGDVEAVTNREIALLDMYARMANVTVDALRALRWPDFEAFTKKAARVAPPMDGR